MRSICAGLLFLSLSVLPVLACSCAPPGPDFPLADAIVEADVAGIYPDSAGKPEDVVVIVVKRALKGGIIGRTEVRTPRDSSACGVSFRVGETVLIAMNQAARGYTTNLCLNLRAREALKQIQ